MVSPLHAFASTISGAAHPPRGAAPPRLPSPPSAAFWLALHAPNQQAVAPGTSAMGTAAAGVPQGAAHKTPWLRDAHGWTDGRTDGMTE